jgi:hypothetical protein
MQHEPSFQALRDHNTAAKSLMKQPKALQFLNQLALRNSSLMQQPQQLLQPEHMHNLNLKQLSLAQQPKAAAETNATRAKLCVSHTYTPQYSCTQPDQATGKDSTFSTS